MRRGVAVFFFKTGKHRAARRVPGAAQINTVVARAGQGAVHASAKADSRFGHADDQHRAGQVSWDLRSQRIETLGHQRRPGWNVPPQYTGDKQKGALGVTPFSETEQGLWLKSRCIDFNLQATALKVCGQSLGADHGFSAAHRSLLPGNTSKERGRFASDPAKTSRKSLPNMPAYAPKSR